MFKIHSIDSGFSRVYYKGKRGDGRRLLICIQDEGRFGVDIMPCTDDGEPLYPLKATKELASMFEVPTGESVLETNVRMYLKKLM